MTTNVEGNDHRSRRIVGRVAVAVTLAVLLGAGLASEAGAAKLCRRADARLERTGRGDRDFDGLSNCRERWILGTSPRDRDSDHDGVEDGEEIENGTDPMDSDSDDDGLDDGEENELGTDPKDPDSDDDGLDDPDPNGELDDEIEGDLEAISCAGGTLTVLAIVIGLTSETEYDGVESCEDLEARFVANGGAHVEVDVTGDLGSGFVAEEVDLEDADNDGSPDYVDDDDDNDGVDDDEDEDDDNDSVDDEEDDDDDDD